MNKTERDKAVIECYKQGNSMKKVGQIMSVNTTTVFNILKKYNVPTRTKGGIYPLDASKIIQMYQSGYSSTQIAEKYNVTIHSITDLLEKYGISRNNRYHNLDLDLDYFSVIDRYDKAYFLGFLIADGNIGKNDNSVSLSLNIKDKHILETFKEKTKNANKLCVTRDTECTFHVKTAKWKADLAQYGVVPQKTSICYIPALSANMMPHLIRGLIDGDGWISDKSCQIGFCGNEQTVTQLRDYIVNNVNVNRAKILHTQPYLWQVTWTGKNNIRKIGQYLYQDKQDCYLKRKYQAYLKIIHDNTEVTI